MDRYIEMKLKTSPLLAGSLHSSQTDMLTHRQHRNGGIWRIIGSDYEIKGIQESPERKVRF